MFGKCHNKSEPQDLNEIKLDKNLSLSRGKQFFPVTEAGRDTSYSCWLDLVISELTARLLATEDRSLLRGSVHQADHPGLLHRPLDPARHREGRGELGGGRGGEGGAGGVVLAVWGGGQDGTGRVGLRVSELVSHLMLLHVSLN